MFGEKSFQFQSFLMTRPQIMSSVISGVVKNAYSDYQNVAQFIYGDTAVTDATPAAIKEAFVAERLGAVYAATSRADAFSSPKQDSVYQRFTDGRWSYAAFRVHPRGMALTSSLFAMRIKSLSPMGQGGVIEAGVIGECTSSYICTFTSPVGVRLTDKATYNWFRTGCHVGSYAVDVLTESFGPSSTTYYLTIGNDDGTGSGIVALPTLTKHNCYSVTAGSALPVEIAIKPSTECGLTLNLRKGDLYYEDLPINIGSDTIATASANEGYSGFETIIPGSFAATTKIGCLDAVAAAAAIMADW